MDWKNLRALPVSLGQVFFAALTDELTDMLLTMHYRYWQLHFFHCISQLLYLPIPCTVHQKLKSVTGQLLCGL